MAKKRRWYDGELVGDDTCLKIFLLMEMINVLGFKIVFISAECGFRMTRKTEET